MSDLILEERIAELGEESDQRQLMIDRLTLALHDIIAISRSAEVDLLTKIEDIANRALNKDTKP